MSAHIAMLACSLPMCAYVAPIVNAASRQVGGRFNVRPRCLLALPAPSYLVVPSRRQALVTDVHTPRLPRHITRPITSSHPPRQVVRRYRRNVPPVTLHNCRSPDNRSPKWITNRSAAFGEGHDSIVKVRTSARRGGEYVHQARVAVETINQSCFIMIIIRPDNSSRQIDASISPLYKGRRRSFLRDIFPLVQGAQKERIDPSHFVMIFTLWLARCVRNAHIGRGRVVSMRDASM